MNSINAFFGALSILSGLYAAWGHGRWAQSVPVLQSLQAQVNAIALATQPAPAPAPALKVTTAVPIITLPDPPGTEYVLAPDGKTLLRKPPAAVPTNLAG